MADVFCRGNARAVVFMLLRPLAWRNERNSFCHRQNCNGSQSDDFRNEIISTIFFFVCLVLVFFCGGGQANTQNVTHNIDQFVTVSLCNLDSVFRNDTTRVIQPEVIYRSDTLGQASSNTIAGSSSGVDRKGSVAIGQSIFYTEDPPQDFGNSGKGHNSKFIIIQLTFNRTFAIFVEWKTCSNRNES